MNRIFRRLTGVGVLALGLVGLLNTSVAKPHRNHPPQNVTAGNNLTLYYSTNSWELHKNDLRDLSHFYQTHRQAGKFIVEGNCDARGSLEDNLVLGRKRAEGVADYLRAFGYPESGVESVSYGENNPSIKGENARAYSFNRRTIIVANQNVLSRALNLLPADVYLIDATGSMFGEPWNTVVRYHYPKLAKTYTFNSCTGVMNTPIEKVTPDCNTPLWDSIGQILSQMQVSQSITVLSDGGDNQSRVYTSRRVITEANNKKIKVSTIAVGVDNSTKQALVDLARETGGNFYVSN